MSELKLRPPKEQSKMAKSQRYKNRDERCRASRHKPSGPPQIGGKPAATLSHRVRSGEARTVGLRRPTLGGPREKSGQRGRIRPARACETQASAQLFTRSLCRCLVRACGTKIPAPSCTFAASNENQRRLGRTACALPLQRRIGSIEPSPLRQFPCSSIQRRKSDGNLRCKTASYGRR